MGVTKLKLAPKSTASTTGSAGRFRASAMLMAIGVSRWQH